ncbi:MAG: PEGA domain-containing protein [Candidatus Competibacteraceae bacterium]|nr:PEGA domain-containing protein [Candidatus Competibacteraceae bacterium]MBK8753685.1 PEGA domain-containing protein [Candidatus Competibacteraceae bacterium]
MDKTLLKVFGWLLALVVELLTVPVWAAENPPPARMTATVVEFTVRGGLDEQAGAILADLMMSAIANTSRFTLKDRLPLSAAAKIAKSQELGSTGLIDPKTAAELGRLYGVDAVVTGGVNKLGDLITVTARLIDTKTASLLRSGQIQGKDIDSIQIKINELATMITAPPEPPKTYALTVVAQPPDAQIRLLNNPVAYQTGVRLLPGDYEVEITRPGYLAHKAPVRIGDRDVTVTVALDAAKYGLTVRPEPADAQIRLLGSSVAYQAGVALPPGSYEIEVSRDGYVTRKFPVRIVDSEVTVPITLDKTPPPLAPSQYRLTVQTDPPQAVVRLVNVKTPYQPGVRLPPGDYPLEISQSGYEPVRMTAKIVDSDVLVPVKLVKQAEPERPKLYRLTVRVDPPNARVRLRGVKTAYKPGIPLPPGNYTVEVSRAGYETKQLPISIADSDLTVPVVLVKQAAPELYQLTVQVDPPGAQVRLRGTGTVYRPGVQLPPGNYTIEVAKSGYETKSTTVRIANSDVSVPITLLKSPEIAQYRLTVQATPPSARVRLVNSAFTYRPGVLLPSGNYTVEVTGRGYETKRLTVRIAGDDVALPVELEKTAAVASSTSTAAPPSLRAGEWRISAVQADSALDSQDRAEVLRIFNGYVGRTVTRDALLDGALRVYQSTGVTLSFTVRENAAGSAELYARAARRVRKTYESSIPIMTRSQLENSGFGVSVQ